MYFHSHKNNRLQPFHCLLNSKHSHDFSGVYKYTKQQLIKLERMVSYNQGRKMGFYSFSYSPHWVRGDSRENSSLTRSLLMSLSHFSFTSDSHALHIHPSFSLITERSKSLQSGAQSSSQIFIRYVKASGNSSFTSNYLVQVSPLQQTFCNQYFTRLFKSLVTILAGYSCYFYNALGLSAIFFKELKNIRIF